MASTLSRYQVHTHNASHVSENRIHSDEVARQFGFKGALVPGVTVFSHMTQPLVARYGEAWLARGSAEVRFDKPAYDGELLTINVADEPDGSHALTCVNAQGDELAHLRATLPEQAPAADARGDIAPAPQPAERPLVTWDLMEIGKPFPALLWSPTAADNLQWCADTRETLPIYREGAKAPLHPGLMLRQGNYVLRHRFKLPAWIHTQSHIRFLEVARVGVAYEVRAIPEEKWQRKGHEFARLFVAIRTPATAGAPARTVAEIAHSMIFRPRAKSA
ncbi:MAG: hypothetical protein FJY56_02515 [Betaproteobacteria bacterium]|nr:hypothetical protein [Betaproteobacteria bacterium]